MRRHLSRAGWPRPRTSDGLPQPWISPVDDLAAKDSKRQRRCAAGMICQVCGLRFTDEAYCVANIDAGVESEGIAIGDTLPEDTGVHAMDHGLLHLRCLRLALSWCPELKRLLAAEQLAVCKVPPGSIEPYGADVLVLDPQTVLHP